MAKRLLRDGVLTRWQVIQLLSGRTGLTFGKYKLMDQLQADMNSLEIMARMEQDTQDAIFLKVTKTPSYFVNGRPLPSFGAQQLADLVREELAK